MRKTAASVITRQLVNSKNSSTCQLVNSSTRQLVSYNYAYSLALMGDS